MENEYSTFLANSMNKKNSLQKSDIINIENSVSLLLKEVKELKEILQKTSKKNAKEA